MSLPSSFTGVAPPPSRKSNVNGYGKCQPFHPAHPQRPSQNKSAHLMTIFRIVSRIFPWHFIFLTFFIAQDSTGFAIKAKTQKYYKISFLRARWAQQRASISAERYLLPLSGGFLGKWKMFWQSGMNFNPFVEKRGWSLRWIIVWCEKNPIIYAMVFKLKIKK